MRRCEISRGLRMRGRTFFPPSRSPAKRFLAPGHCLSIDTPSRRYSPFSRMGLAARLLVVLGFVLLDWPGTARGQFDVPEPAGGAAGEPTLTLRWEVGVVIEASGGPSAGLRGTLPMPTDWPEQSVRIVTEEISPLVTRVDYRDLDGVRQMLFTIPQLPVGQTAEAVVTLEIIRRSLPPIENPESWEIARNLPRDVRRYLGPSPQIDVRNSRVRNQVREIVEEREGGWEQVQAIYDWVRDNITYREGREQNVVATMSSGWGGKHELTSLFIALCRAHGVPARTVWVPDHVYAEFYLVDGEGNGRWIPCQVAGPREFGSVSDNRPILQKGENIRVPEHREPQRFVAEYLTGSAGRGMGTPRVEFLRRTVAAD